MTAPGQSVNFRKRDLTAAIDCARKAGIEIRRIEIEGGRVTIVTGKPEEGPDKPANPWDGAEL